MTCPHFDISIRTIGRNAPAVSGAAYISASKLWSEFQGKTVNYQSKQHELVHSEIMLPENAPKEFADRQTLWNSVDMFEKQIPAQVSRRIVMALPREIPMEQNIEMVREYCQKNFVDQGMCCDFAIHDPDPPGHNPHAHVMLTMRSLDEHGKWMAKCRKVYDLDPRGERIRLPSGRWKSHRENINDWNNKEKVEVWRESWETIQNEYLERSGSKERVSLKTLEAQGIERQPTVHMGPAASAMERKGTETSLGNLNREIRKANHLMQSIRNMIRKLADWIGAVSEAWQEIEAEEQRKAKPVYLGDLLQAKLELRSAERSSWSHGAQTKGSIRDLARVSDFAGYLNSHKILTIGDLNEHLAEVYDRTAAAKKEVKNIERRIRTIAGIRKACADIQETKELYQKYARIGWKSRKEKFRAEHPEELNRHEKAERFLRKNVPDRKISFTALSVEEKRLKKDLSEENRELASVQKDLRTLKEIRYFVKELLPEIVSEENRITKEPVSIRKRLEENQRAIQEKRKAETHDAKRTAGRDHEI